MFPQVFRSAQRLPVLLLVCVLLCNSACYRYRVMAPNFDPATEYKSKTVHSLFWGLIQTNPLRPDNCTPGNGLDEVRISTNFGYALITVATLGIWCPMKIEWRCTKPCPPPVGKL